jgi:hypothetical protein
MRMLMYKFAVRDAAGNMTGFVFDAGALRISIFSKAKFHTNHFDSQTSIY